MKYQRKRTLHLHSLYNYWFCYENGKKNYPQAYKSKKIKMPKFIDTELESESESVLKSYAEL